MITLTTKIDDEAAEFITKGLTDFNEASCPMIAERRKRTDDPFPIHTVARTDDDALVGGLVGQVWDTWHWLQVDVIWVAEPYRKAGLGTKLMEAVEADGRRQGCIYSRLTTASYQAVDFYLKLGYNHYGQLDDFPPRETTYYMWKRL